jgi:hypothetical protein
MCQFYKLFQLGGGFVPKAVEDEFEATPRG